MLKYDSSLVECRKIFCIICFVQTVSTHSMH